MFAYLFICAVFALLPAWLITHWLYTEYTKYPEGIKGTPKKKEAIEQAKKEGRYTVAHLVKCGPSDNSAPYATRVKYEYTYNNKRYHLTFDHTSTQPGDRPPETMEVYFRKSPKKAKIYSDFGQMETETKYVFCFFWIVLTVVFFVLLIRKVKEMGLL